MLSARLEQPSHRDLGIEHCRERTTMRWDSMRQDDTVTVGMAVRTSGQYRA